MSHSDTSDEHGTQDLTPVTSGYETPLDTLHEPVYETPRETPRGPRPPGPKRSSLSDEGRRKISETQRRRHAARRVKLGKQNTKTSKKIPDDAEIVDRDGVKYYTWVDDEGKRHRRKVRRARSRVKRLRRVSLEQEIRRVEREQARLDKLEEAGLKLEFQLALRKSYARYYGVTDLESISRGALRNWLKFFRCGGIPRRCPWCLKRIERPRPKAWRARLRERIVVCVSCNKELGPETRRPHEMRALIVEHAATLLRLVERSGHE